MYGIKISEEFEGIDFKSTRLEKRFIQTMECISKEPEKSIWLSSGSRSESKAIYRMLGNEKIKEAEILRVHREATKSRICGNAVILAIQDTTSANYNSQRKMEGIGYIGDKTLGINIHSCIAVTPEGLALGVLSQSWYTRAIRKDDTLNHDQKKVRAIEEKESYRWLEAMETSSEDMPTETKMIHICDREGDMYELFEKAARTGEIFLIRVIQNRTTTAGQKAIDEIKKSESAGKISVIIPRDSRNNRKERQTMLKISYENFDIKRPLRKNINKELSPSVNMNVIYVREDQEDETIEPIEWVLATNDEITCFEDAYEKVCNYIQRWKIERFHYVLKSGCKIEKLQERTVEKTVLLILMYSIISVRILNLTYLARLLPELGCDAVFCDDEWQVLYCAANKTNKTPKAPYPIELAIKFLAQLGGFNGAKSDGLPGLKVIWLGLNKLYTLLAYRDFSGSSLGRLVWGFCKYDFNI